MDSSIDIDRIGEPAKNEIQRMSDEFTKQLVMMSEKLSVLETALPMDEKKMLKDFLASAPLLLSAASSILEQGHRSIAELEVAKAVFKERETEREEKRRKRDAEEEAPQEIGEKMNIEVENEKETLPKEAFIIELGRLPRDILKLIDKDIEVAVTDRIAEIILVPEGCQTFGNQFLEEVMAWDRDGRWRKGKLGDVCGRCKVRRKSDKCGGSKPCKLCRETNSGTWCTWHLSNDYFVLFGRRSDLPVLPAPPAISHIS